MEYDYSELLVLIKRYFGTQEGYAKYLGVSTPSLTGRIRNRLQFKQNEIARSKDAFGLDSDGVLRVFFTPKTKKTKLKEGGTKKTTGGVN